MWIVPLIRWSSNCIDVNCQNSDFGNIPRTPAAENGRQVMVEMSADKSGQFPHFHHLDWEKKNSTSCPNHHHHRNHNHHHHQPSISRHLVEPRGTSVSWILFTRLNRIQCKIGGYNAVKKPRYPGQPLLDLCNEGPTLIACQNFTRHTTVTLWMSSSQ